MSDERPFYDPETTRQRETLVRTIWKIYVGMSIPTANGIRSDPKVQGILANIRAMLAEGDKNVQAFFRPSDIDFANDFLVSLLSPEEIEKYKHVPEVVKSIDSYNFSKVLLSHFATRPGAIDDIMEHMRSNGMTSTIWINPISFLDWTS